ncbi:MAG: di-trans,poly-cis-decaprenylcistransferase [Burkholderiales bacterium]|nr:di-trans,poly-cis-decaprenylcistransferase [Burkholderiales bacterium]MCZ2135906.1 di-trans,poly-cis-decaprenylcistransferase [Burkholderiales bacterium]
MHPPVVPRHIAVVMDGNGRWAQRRLLPRVAGHKQGVHAVRSLIRAARERGVEVLTVFAFSSENWQRPPDEVSFLMDLLLRALREEVDKLHSNDVRFRVVGDVGALGRETQQLIDQAQALTEQNRGLCLNVAVNYGGRWDIEQAVARAVAAGDARAFANYLSFADQPDPDLFIRTGGERRISNFLLWQLAYTELYFCDTLWPDFGEAEFAQALAWFAARERRFGRTGEQVREPAALPG